ncbi:MAG: putative zinc-binding protein [Planctomycetota bacterium]
MADCCCSAKTDKNVLIYACSGGANVAEAADLAARQLAAEGCGGMFCLAGIGAGIQGMVQTAKDADVNLVIDGCPMDCAKKCFENAGVDNYTFIRVTDLGIEKLPKGNRATSDDVARIVSTAKHCLGCQ